MNVFAFNWSDFLICNFSSVCAENLRSKKPNDAFALFSVAAFCVRAFDLVVLVSVFGFAFGGFYYVG